MKDAAIFPWIDIIIPLLIMFGIGLMFWIIYEERNRTEDDAVKSLEFDDFPDYPGWKQYDCSEAGWHKYKVDENLDDGVQGFINQIFSSIDKFFDGSNHHFCATLYLFCSILHSVNISSKHVQFGFSAL